MKNYNKSKNFMSVKEQINYLKKLIRKKQFIIADTNQPKVKSNGYTIQHIKNPSEEVLSSSETKTDLQLSTSAKVQLKNFISKSTKKVQLKVFKLHKSTTKFIKDPCQKVKILCL